MSVSAQQLSFALGAEVTGVDLSQPMSDGLFREINDIFLEHHVILFRGQPVTREHHIALARQFGEVLVPPKEIRPAGEDGQRYPEISMVVSKPTTEPGRRRIIGGDWHSDRSECPRPASASLLRCVSLPGVGGDTMFANMHRAYDELSLGMQKLLDGLYGVYLDRRPDFDMSTPERYRQSRRDNPAAAQPVVRTHAESGGKALYVNKETNHFVGMSEEESKPIINYLVEHATRPENVYRHVWQEDDLIIWDNRSVLHMALRDYDRSQLRHMERVAVIGDQSGYDYLGPIGRWPAVAA